MDQNPHHNRSQSQPPLRKIHNSASSTTSSGDKHYAQIRATTAYRNLSTAMPMPRASPARTRTVMPPRTPSPSPNYSSYGCRRTVSSISKAKEVLDNLSKKLNPPKPGSSSTPRRSQSRPPKLEASGCSFERQKRITLPYASKPEVPKIQMVCETKPVKAVHAQTSLQIKNSDSPPEARVEDNDDVEACWKSTLEEAESPTINSAEVEPQNFVNSLPTQQQTVGESSDPDLISFEGREYIQHHHPPCPNSQQQPGLTPFDSDHWFQPHATQSTYAGYPQCYQSASPPPPISNCFSCASVPHSHSSCIPPRHFQSVHTNLPQSSEQFHSPCSSYSNSGFYQDPTPPAAQPEVPDLIVQTTGKCMINCPCLVQNDQNGVRCYNIQGFELRFYQSEMFYANDRSIRLDFSTMGFLEPESFQTEMDDKGNLFIFGNIYSDQSTSRLWISLQHCPSPDRIIVENPYPYYYTVEIPC